MRIDLQLRLGRSLALAIPKPQPLRVPRETILTRLPARGEEPFPRLGPSFMASYKIQN
jgi:hypothetical protein